MEAIKNFLIFIGITLCSVIIFNLFARACVFVQYGSFISNEETNTGMLIVGLIVGVTLAIYHFCENE